MGDTDKGGARKVENCPFYPACYIAGDCGFEDWKVSDCGLPPEVKAEKKRQWLADLELRNNRWKVGERLKSEALRGEHDHLIAQPGSEHP